MSRIGKKSIPVPETVKVAIEESGRAGRRVICEGPCGRLEQEIVPEFSVEFEEDSRLLHIQRHLNTKRYKALHGLYRSILANMVKGVAEGFERRLEMIGTGDFPGVGYSAKLSEAKDKGAKALVLGVGYAQPVEIAVPQGIEIQLPDPTHIIIRGADKQQVGEFAAQLRAIRTPEVYKGRGIRYQGEVVRLKPGKAFVSGE
jgi:large subunit ribosomal protein L6